MPARSEKLPDRSADDGHFSPGLQQFANSAEVYSHYARKGASPDELRNLRKFLIEGDRRIFEAGRQKLEEAVKKFS